jgi:hypothetical protein
VLSPIETLPSEHELLYETAAELKAAELDITSHPEETQPERLDMQLSAVGEQLGRAQESPVRTQELLSPNLKLLPSEHELHETAAQLKAAEFDITSQQPLSTMLRSVSEGVVIVDCNGRAYGKRGRDPHRRLLGALGRCQAMV